jgi:hypothetical protein
MVDGRFFTLDEANGQLQWLEPLLQRIRSLRNDLPDLNRQLQALVQEARGNGHGGVARKVEDKRKGLDALETLLDTLNQAMVDRGILLKDPDRGLVDFPALREGREVYLCWLLGETTIEFWHDIDAGFAGRQPL